MDDIIRQLEVVFPPYLTPEESKDLWSELKNFPDSMNYYLQNSDRFPAPLQGDLWKGLPLVRIRSGEAETAYKSGILLSNSCDISIENQRNFNPNVLFAPLISLEMWKKHLTSKGMNQQKIDAEVTKLKSQRVTSFMYVPEITDVIPESVVKLDDIHRLPLSEFTEMQEKGEISRLKALSQAGFYLFIIKIAIHFNRLLENVPRFENANQVAN